MLGIRKQQFKSLLPQASGRNSLRRRPAYGNPKRCVGEVLDPSIAPDPTEGELVTLASEDMAVYRLMRDVEAAPRQTAEQPSRLRPRKCRRALVVIGKIRARKVLCELPDSFPRHRETFELMVKNGRVLRNQH